LKLSCSCHMTACHHHDGEAVVASRPRGWTQARCKAAWTRAEEEKPESSPLWTRPRCPLRPRALPRRRCPPSPPTSRRTRPAHAPRTPPRPPLPRGVSSPWGDSTRKLRSTYALSRRVTEGMISGDADPSPLSSDAVAAAVACRPRRGALRLPCCRPRGSRTEWRRKREAGVSTVIFPLVLTRIHAGATTWRATRARVVKM